MTCRETLKTWFRRHRRSSTTSISSTDDESTRSSTDESVTSTPRQKKTKQKKLRQRICRALSSDTSLCRMHDLVGLDSATQQELNVSAAVAAEEERRRMASKARRRFTIHGISHHRHDEVGWRQNTMSAGSPSSMYASPMYASSPSHTRRFSLSRSKPVSLTPEAHPSIIYIDCPP